MPGFMSDPIGNPAGEAEGATAIPSGAFEQGEWFPDLQMLGRAIGRANAEFGVSDPDTGAQIAPPEPTITTEDANARFGSAGAPELGVKPLKFDAPVPASVAESMAGAKRDEIIRADAAARAPGGLAAGAARMGASFVQSMLDPLDLAAAFVPVVGEARMGGLIARAGLDVGEGFAGRTALRVATGAVQGATGQAGLSAVRYGLSKQEQGDYSASDAMADVLMGGVMGGGLHALIGGAADLIGRRFAATPAARAVDADPEVRETAARTAIGQMADGRPVDVAGAIETTAAARAEAELTNWARLQRGIDAETDANMTAAIGDTGAPDRTAALAAASARLDGLRQNVAGLESDLADAHARAIQGGMDPVTADRLSAIQDEMSGAIPTAQRMALQAEQQMLMDGRGSVDVAGTADELPQARTLSEIGGLQTALSRARDEANSAEVLLNGLRGADASASDAAGVQQVATDRLLRLQGARLASREEVARALAARTIRRFAGAIGAPLDADADEAGAWAAKVLRGEMTPQEALAGIRGVRDAGLASGDADVAAAVARARGRLAAERDSAASALINSDAFRRATGAPDPETEAVRRQAEAVPALQHPELADERPPPFDAAEMAELEAGLRELAENDPEVAAALADMDSQGRLSEGKARAYEAAGRCMMMRAM